MAQILKFSNGGNASKVGSLTIGTKKYEANEKFLQELYDYSSKSLEPEVASQFNNIINSLKSGADLSYANHELVGDVNFDVGNPGQERMSKRVAPGLSNRETAARKAISALANFVPKPEEAPVKRKFDFSNTLNAEYERDDKGAFVLDENENKKFINSATNAAILDRLSAVRIIANSPDSYFDFVGSEGLDTKKIRDWYNMIGENNLKDLEGRFRDGSWTEGDLETVNDINILLDRALTSKEQAAKSEHDVKVAEQTAKSRYTSRGFDPSYSAYIGYNSGTGKFNITNQELLTLLGGGNAWLNEDFLKAYPNYAFLLNGHDNGLFVINGEVYDANDQTLLNNPVFQRFVADNKKRVAPSNNIIKQKWTTSNRDWRPLNEWNGTDMYSANDNIWVQDLTGNYDDLGSFGESNLSHLFLARPSNITDEMYNMYGHISPEYLTYTYIDGTGKVQTPGDQNAFLRYLNTLNLASDSKSNKYYSNTPSYLREKVTSRYGYLVKFNDNILYNPDNGLGYMKYNEQWYKIPVETMQLILNGTAGNSINPEKRGYTKVSMPSQKQGGKIPKAQMGYQFPTEEEFNNGHRVTGVTLSNLNELITKINPIKKNLLDPKVMAEIASYELNNSIKSNKSNKSYYGYTEGNRPFISPDMVLGISDLITSVASTNKSAAKQKEGVLHGMLGAQKQNVSEIYPIFTDNGLGRTYDQRISNLRTYKPISSDTTQTASQQLMREGQIDALTGEKNLKLSQALDQYRTQLLGTQQQYNTLRTQTANENRKAWETGLAQMDMIDANRIATQGQSAKNFIYQLRQNYAKDLETQKQIDQMNAQAELEKYAKAAFEEAGGYNAIEDETTRKSYIDSQNWLGAYAYIDPQGYKQLQSKYLGEMLINPKYRHSWWKWWTFDDPVYAKKGTKLSKRSVSDQFFLNQNKASSKAANDLNRDIIKLFIQMMK